MSILIIAAHPDDEILGCGCLIPFLQLQKESAHVLILTNGADTRYNDEKKKKLREHCIEANRILGSQELYLENLPNQGLETIPLLTITKTIEKYLDQVQPQTVFTHSAHDLNLDHQLVNRATLTACRPIPTQCVKEIYTYWIPSSSDWNQIPENKGFQPNFFIDATPFIETKKQAMQAYQSEALPFPHPRSPQSLEIHAKFFGLCVGMEMAEPFCLIRKLVKI